MPPARKLQRPANRELTKEDLPKYVALPRGCRTDLEALLLGLVIYTAAFIAEVVRAELPDQCDPQALDR